MDREDNNVKHGWNPAEELLHVDRVRCLEYFR
jgi:hypothetical protein